MAPATTPMTTHESTNMARAFLPSWERSDSGSHYSTVCCSGKEAKRGEGLWLRRRRATMQVMGQSDNGVAWRPDGAHLARSRLLRLVRAAGCRDVNEFRTRAAGDPAWFWDLTCAELGVVWATPPSTTLDLSAGKPWAKWFPDGRMNYTVSAVDRWVTHGRD